MTDPHPEDGWRAIVAGLVARNGSGDMGLYLQVSRGAATGRDHFFPDGLTPTVFAMASALAPTDLGTAGLRAITGPDTRWARCDIKSTALLANVLLRQAAREAGAGEYIMLRDGYVTEGSGSSVLIVEGDAVVTRPDGHAILPGTTLRLVRELATRSGFRYREEAIGEARLRRADEIWLTAALRGVAPVVRLDGAPVGAGTPGPAWRAVAEAYELRKRA
jgi:D-alanine transaminase